MSAKRAYSLAASAGGVKRAWGFEPVYTGSVVVIGAQFYPANARAFWNSLSHGPSSPLHAPGRQESWTLRNTGVLEFDAALAVGDGDRQARAGHALEQDRGAVEDLDSD